MSFIKFPRALFEMSVAKVLLYYFALWALLALCATSCHGQTVDVGAFKESTLGGKLADAQTNGCSLDSNVRCVLVLKPELNVFPLGTMPTRCARCVWLDWTGGGLPFGSASYSPTINGVPLQIPGTSFVLGMNHPGFDFSTYALGYPTITTLPLIAGSNTATFAPCPYGMSDTSGGLVPIPMNVHDLGAGSDEVVTVSLLSAGTPGSPLCTVTFTAASPHTLWSLQSATGGVQEAVNDNTTLAIWIRSKGTGFKAPVSTVTTSIYGTGEESALINGDPGNDSLIKLTGRTGQKVRVSGMQLANLHSTVTDTAEHNVTCQNCTNAEIDNLLITAGKVGVFVTSSGAGGQVADVHVHHIEGRGAGFGAGNSLMDGTVWVNGDGVSLPSLRVTVDQNFSWFLATTGNSGPPHDFSVEDCDHCEFFENHAYDDTGFTESSASPYQMSANHDAALTDTWFHHNYASKSGGANFTAFQTATNKTYNHSGYTDNFADGYKQCGNIGQGYTADYQLNDYQFKRNTCNLDNSGTYGIILTGTGSHFKEKVTIADNTVFCSGAGTSLAGGIRVILIDQAEVTHNTITGCASHAIDWEGSSNGTIQNNWLYNNGQTTTGDGILMGVNTAIGSSTNHVTGNYIFDSQASPTQRFGINNNSASNGTNYIAGNFVWGHLTDQIHDTVGTFQLGINFQTVAGTNLAGKNQPFFCSPGTGTGAGCKIQFNVYDTQTTGTTAHAVHTLESWNSATIADPNNDTAQFAGSHGELWERGSNTELLTLSTVGATTDTTNNLLPANSIIESVVARVTTTITTATDWKLGDATTAGRFSAANATLTAGTTQVGLVHSDQTGAAGPKQTAAAKVRVTTTGTPGAGVIRITVFYRRFVPPTS